MTKYPRPEIKRILLGRNHGLGDDVMALPLISQLKQVFPLAHLTVMCRQLSQPIFAGNPLIDEIIIDELDAQKKNQPSSNIFKLLNFARQIKAKKFDLSVLTWGNETHAYLGWLAGIPWRIGDKLTYRAGWTFNLGLKRKFYHFNYHYLELNLQLLRPVCPNCETIISPTINFKDHAFIEQISADHNFNTNDVLIAFSLGTSGANKYWRPERQIELIKLLLAEPKVRVLLLGGQEFAGQAQTISQQFSKEQVINLVGQSDVGQLISILRLCQLHICFDSGPMHLGAALKVPTLAIFLSKSQLPTQWGPWETEQIILKRGTSPCPKRCSAPSCQPDLCQEDVTPAEVYTAAQKLLNHQGLKNKPEIRAAWQKLSYSIVLWHNNSSKEAKDITNCLKQDGYKALLVRQNTHLSTLIKLFNQEKVNLLHLIGQPSLFVRLRLFLLKKYYKTDLVIATGLPKSISSQDLINYYETLVRGQ